jgi:hypothetical protein
MPGFPECCYDAEFEMVFELELPSGAEVGLARCATCGTYWMLYLRIDVEEAGGNWERAMLGDGETALGVMVQLTSAEARSLAMLECNLSQEVRLARIGQTRLDARPHLYFRDQANHVNAVVSTLEDLARVLDYADTIEPEPGNESFTFESIWLG